MMKSLKLLGVLLVSFMVFGLCVNAETNIASSKNLEDCLSNDTVCTLSDSITLDKSIELSGEKNVKLDLNGKTLLVGGIIHVKDGYSLTVTGEGKVEGLNSVATYLFRVLPNGTLNLENGTFKNEHPSGGVIRVIGNNLNSTTITKVNVASGALLEGSYGISIYGYNYDSYDKSLGKRGQYAEGIEIDFAGKLNTKYMGMTINGYVEFSETDYPVINIKDGAVIESESGIYAAGYGKWNIGSATFNTINTGIGIKAGQIYIDGAKVTTTGANNPDPEKWGNGINASGSAIQIETNKSYSDNIILNVKSGDFTSKNGYAVLEYLGETDILEFSISGGKFTSAKDLDVFKTTTNLDLTGKITGGTYSSDVNKYLGEGLFATKTGDLFVVGKPVVEPEIEVINPEKIEEVKDVVVGVKENDKTASILNDSILKDTKLAEATKDISVNVNLEIEAIKEENSSDEVKEAMKSIKEKAGKATVAHFFDVSILITNTNTGAFIGNVTNLTEEIELMILLPESLKNNDSKLNRNYFVLREHDGKVETINAELSKDGKYLVFKTNKFSTYALAYEDVAKEVAEPTVPATPAVPQTFDGITTTIIFASLALISLVGISLYFKKHSKNN